MPVAFSSAPERPVAGASFAQRLRRLTVAGAALLTLGGAACGGGGGGDITPPGGNNATATLNLAVQLALASGTGAVTMRVAPTYDLAAGGTTALATQTVSLTAAATQQVPLTLNIGGCLGDAARTGGAGAGCTVRATLTVLAAGDRVVDTETIGPVTLSGGGTGAASVSFVEVVPPVTVTVAAAGGGSGRVTSAPAGLDCVVVNGAGSGTCATTFPAGGDVTLTAAATAGSQFTGWAGDCAAAAAAPTCTVAATAARNVTAAFSPLRTLTVSLPGTGTGAVTSAPAGVDCRVNGGTGCAANFANGTVVTLTAAPAANVTFAGWGGACTGTQATCQVTMDQARTVSATFTAQSANVQLTINGGGAGRLTLAGVGVTNGVCDRPTNTATPVVCTATAAIGAALTLQATAPNTSSFVSWAGACAAFVNPTCTFTLPAGGAAVSARFEPVPLDTVQVTAATTSGTRTGRFLLTTVLGGTFTTSDSSGVVTATTTSGGTVAYTATVYRGSQVSLNFRPDGAAPGAGVQSWSGVCSATTPPANCQFSTSANVSAGVLVNP